MRHDFAGVVERMERLRAPLEYAWGVMSHLTGVKNSDPLRDAHQELQVCATHVSATRSSSERGVCSGNDRAIGAEEGTQNFAHAGRIECDE